MRTPTTQPQTRTRPGTIRRLSRRALTLATAGLLAVAAVVLPTVTAKAASVDASHWPALVERASPTC
jgi:hypothetical protein